MDIDQDSKKRIKLKIVTNMGLNLLCTALRTEKVSSWLPQLQKAYREVVDQQDDSKSQYFRVAKLKKDNFCVANSQVVGDIFDDNDEVYCEIVETSQKVHKKSKKIKKQKKVDEKYSSEKKSDEKMKGEEEKEKILIPKQKTEESSKEGKQKEKEKEKKEKERERETSIEKEKVRSEVENKLSKVDIAGILNNLKSKFPQSFELKKKEKKLAVRIIQKSDESDSSEE